MIVRAADRSRDLLGGWTARRAVRAAIQVAALAFFVVFILAHAGGMEAVDAHVYWLAARHPASPYTPGSLPGDQVYQYSPAFAQLLAPLGALPFEWFAVLWMVLEAGALVIVVGPIIGLLLLVLPQVGLVEELVVGNIHVLMAGAIVLSFRWPAAWSFPILTKVTPGIGLAWFAARLEWRRLAVAITVTALIASVSAVLAPAAWAEWLRWVVSNPGVPANPHQLLPWMPLLVRLPIGIALVILAARLDLRGLVPVAIWISLPVIWYNSPVLLAASIPLARDDLRRARKRDNASLTRRDPLPATHGQNTPSNEIRVG